MRERKSDRPSDMSPDVWATTMYGALERFHWAIDDLLELWSEMLVRGIHRFRRAR